MRAAKLFWTLLISSWVVSFAIAMGILFGGT